MNVAALIRILGAKGMSANDIADVVEMTMPAEPSRADRKRERDRVRIEEKRAAKSQESRDMSDIGDIARQGDTLSEGSQGSLSPEPPNPPNPPNLSQEPPISPKIRVPRAKIASDFEVFWEAYPRKVAKGDAERAFPKALAQTTLETLTDAARAMGRAAEDSKFIPHPASWLNGKRWLDTHDPPPSAPGSTGRVFNLAKFEAERAEQAKRLEAEGYGT